MEVVFILVTLLRLLVPFSILRYPLLGTLLAIGADSLDWHVLPLHTSEDYRFYQVWDKFLDTYYLSFAAYTVIRWQERVAKHVSIFLYIFRVCGVLLFELTNIRLLLFLFPNLFESFFLFYICCKKYIKARYLFTSLVTIIPILAVLLIPKLLQEYAIHVMQRLPWQEISLQVGLFADQFVWTSLYLVVPLGMFVHLMRRPSYHV